MDIDIDQRAVIMLAMDFDEPASKLFEQRDACGLIIDEDPAAAIGSSAPGAG